MNSEMFDHYLETQAVPKPREVDVVILGNLSSHKSPGAGHALRQLGRWFLLVPCFSPNLNPIEMTFSKLKFLIPKGAAPTYDWLWQAVGHVWRFFANPSSGW